MMTHDLESAAREAAGNWQKFECFAWDHYSDDDAENWAIAYTHNRDSGLLDLSNAAAIEKALDPFTEGEDPDVRFESHNHWAVGHVDGFAIRVYRNGSVTEAFKTYYDLQQSLSDYPVLDDEDYSNREYEATIENIGSAAYSLRHEYDLPEDWESEVFSWFWDNDQSAVENRDDQGGYPSEEQLREAFAALGWEPIDE